MRDSIPLEYNEKYKILRSAQVNVPQKLPHNLQVKF